MTATQPTLNDEEGPIVGFDSHARRLEDAARDLASATLWTVGQEPIAEGTYRTVRDLVCVARAIGETATNLANGLAMRGDLDRVRLDHNGRARHPSPGDAIDTAQAALGDAARAAHTLETALSDAQSTIATIADAGNRPPSQDCECGDDITDHDSPDNHGPCLATYYDDDTDGWVDCDCRRFQQRNQT